jgi:Sec-independent protein translocase protein TatA
MDFLGVGPLELIFVFIIIILVIGPKDLGKTARTLGRFLNRVYKSEEWKALTQASRTLRTLPNRLAREAELEELNEIKESIEGTAQELKQTQQEFSRETRKTLSGVTRDPDPAEAMKAWTTPLPESESKSDSVEEQADDSPEPAQEES